MIEDEDPKPMQIVMPRPRSVIWWAIKMMLGFILVIYGVFAVAVFLMWLAGVLA